MRALRTLVIGTMLILVLASCEMTVRFSTKLEAGGAGTFSVGVVLDRDAREQIDIFAEKFGRKGFASVEALFDGLEADGWKVERTQPGGGLAFEASRPFTDPTDFGRVLGELRTAREQDDPGLSQGAFSLDIGAERTFLRSNTSFSGEIDTTVPDPTQEQQALIEFIRRVLRIEVRTELAGPAGELEGPASSDGGLVVWTPAYGTSMVFGARSSSIRLGSLLMLLIPVLVLLGALGWILIARRDRVSREGLPSAIEWEQPSSIGEASSPTIIDLEEILGETTTNGRARAHLEARTQNEPPPI